MSSELSQQTNGARPRLIASLMAAACPLSGALRHHTNCSRQRSMTPRDPSLDPPSTSMTSMSTGCAKAEQRVVSRKRPWLREGIATVTRGLAIAGAKRQASKRTPPAESNRNGQNNRTHEDLSINLAPVRQPRKRPHETEACID